MKRRTVIFLDREDREIRRVHPTKERTLYHLIDWNDYDKQHPYCNGQGRCGQCLISVVEGEDLLEPEVGYFRERYTKIPNVTLACHTPLPSSKEYRLVIKVLT